MPSTSPLKIILPQADTSPATAQAPSVQPVAPPTPQEIQRKLSIRDRPQKRTPATTQILASPPQGTARVDNGTTGTAVTAAPSVVSGTESDSDPGTTSEKNIVSSSPTSSFTQSHMPKPASTGGANTVAMTPSTSAQRTGSWNTSALSAIAEMDQGEGDERDEEGEESDEMEPLAAQTILEGTDNRDIMSGYLWKKGERRKTWKKRWFVLRPQHLAFYKSSAEYQLLRLLDLKDVHTCSHVTLKRHPHSFALISPSRTYYLQAEDDRKVQRWIDGVNEAKEALKSISTQGSGAVPVAIPTTPGATSRFGSAGLTGVSPSSYELYTGAHSGPRGLGGITSESESDDFVSHSPVISSFPFNMQQTPTRGGGIPASVVGSPTAKDPTKVVLTGYLMKCQSKRRNWRKRWFVLTGEKLLYYPSHMDTKRQRVIELPQILDALEYDLPLTHRGLGQAMTSAVSPPVPEGSLDDAGSSHTFKIVTAKRSLLLCAPSEEEEIKWMSTIRALIARRTTPGMGPGVVGSTATAGGVVGARRRSASGTSVDV